MDNPTDADPLVLAEKIAALDRHVTSEFRGLRELLKSQRESDQLAIKTALDASQELAARHNDLIRHGEQKDATYALKEDTKRLEAWQSRLTGGMVILAVIGISNLWKIWTG